MTAMQAIFDRCPVIDVDPKLSLARYCLALKQTLAQAEQYLRCRDLERCVLLFVKCAQVANRTLPQHPEYSLPQSESWLKELRRISACCFLRLEQLKSEVDALPEPEAIVPGQKDPDSGRRPVVLDPNIVRSFLKLTKSDLRVQTMALLAGRLDDIGQNAASFRVAALIVPPQRGTKDNCEMLDENTVMSLQEAKGLFTIGWLATHTDDDLRPSSIELRHHGGLQAMLPESTFGIVSGRSSADAKFFVLTESGLASVLRQPSRASDGAGGSANPERKDYVLADHVTVAPPVNGKPEYKVYDLRQG